ncbi:MAG TPA: hypothetical protein VM010_02080 [Chitinophagaceae bacterium]|nr:hypothetical protein [Chitinophagaceae bacterium]
MKNVHFSGIALTRLFKPFMVALLVVGLTNAASAQATDKQKETPVEVKYVGSETGKPLFQIAFNNPQGEEVAVTLRDENGFTIYSDVTKDKSYARKLQFNELDNDKMKLTLILRSKKDTQSQTFEITKNIRTVEDVAVVSL